MKKIVVSTLALVAVAAVVFFGRAFTARSTPPPGGDEVARVTRRNVGAVVKATGVIKPRVGAEVRVGSRLSGVVKRLYVKVGDAVEKGRLLAELDDRDLVALRDQ